MMDDQGESTAESSGREIVSQLFARVRSGDSGAADLFAEDAVITGPNGYEVVGREAIRGHYARNIAQNSPQPQIQVLLTEPPWFVTILEVVLGTGDAKRAVDLIKIEGGEISRLELWTQTSSILVAEVTT